MKQNELHEGGEGSGRKKIYFAAHPVHDELKGLGFSLEKRKLYKNEFGYTHHSDYTKGTGKNKQTVTTMHNTHDKQGDGKPNNVKWIHSNNEYEFQHGDHGKESSSNFSGLMRHLGRYAKTKTVKESFENKELSQYFGRILAEEIQKLDEGGEGSGRKKINFAPHPVHDELKGLGFSLEKRKLYKNEFDGTGGYTHQFDYTKGTGKNKQTVTTMHNTHDKEGDGKVKGVKWIHSNNEYEFQHGDHGKESSSNFSGLMRHLGRYAK